MAHLVIFVYGPLMYVAGLPYPSFVPEESICHERPDLLVRLSFVEIILRDVRPKTRHCVVGLAFGELEAVVAALPATGVGGAATDARHDSRTTRFEVSDGV